jgi:hypothetical protein
MSSSAELPTETSSGSLPPSSARIEESIPDTAEKQGDIQTEKQLLAERIQFITLCWSIVITGWNDGSTGSTLPFYMVGF